MPIVRSNGILIYFAHVPKCAGSSIENYLNERFGALSFIDMQYLGRPAEKKIGPTSPQHLDKWLLDILFDRNFFDHYFAVVRHPAARLISVYNYAIWTNRIHWTRSFDSWVNILTEKKIRIPGYLDNHCRPMGDLVPDNSHVFKLEDGFDALTAWLDMATNTTGCEYKVPLIRRTDPSALFPSFQDSPARWLKSKFRPRPPQMTSSTLSKIYNLYREDYERFDYDPEYSVE